VAKHRGIGVICAVDNEDFDTWKDRQPSTAEWFGTPYSVCLFAAIDIARQYLDDAKIDEDIFYLIESGATGRKQGENFLRRIKTNEELDNRFHMRGYTFIGKGDPDGKTLSFETLRVAFLGIISD